MILAVLPNLLLTVAIESCLSLLFHHKEQLKFFLVVASANTITNICAQIGYNHYFINLWIVEVAVIAVEVVVFRSICITTLRESIILSIVFNTMSVLVGILLYGVILA
jgi:hypothetical protein